ncbi:MAG: S26 family signal peptidase [Burkholderiales bacterium]|nr:S26 family signal peptidase [Burkholderiales bacterium]
MKPHWILAWTSLGLAACLLPALTRLPVQLVFNPSDSVSRGWYLVEVADELHRGDTVLVRLPARVQAFAAQRGYLPKGVPLLKRIEALPPQRVCIRGRVVFVDGHAVATALAHDSQQLSLPTWSGCRALAADEMFLLSDSHPASFDSRYWGPMNVSAVIGSARPLWTWEGP